MTDREKLIKILVSLNLPYECDEALGWMADKLIANGVTVQPIQPEKPAYDISEGIFTLEEVRAILLPLSEPPGED